MSAGALVLVATPIGNLGDLSPRAVHALREADVIAAEDTRRTRALLTHAEVPAAGRLRAVHAHNEHESAGWIVDGALVLRPCRHVHTAGMRFAIDVAFCDAAGVVLRTCSLAPWRMSAFVRRAEFVIEAEAGAFDRWRLQCGDRLELRE